jgi:hypothetical protein
VLSPTVAGPQEGAPFKLIEAPNLLLQKFPARAFVAEVRLELGPCTEYQRAGLAIVGKAYAALDARPDSADGGLRLSCIVDGATHATARVPGSAVILRIEVADGGACTFSYQIPGQPAVALPVQFTAVEGAWVGAKLGIYAVDTRPVAGASGASLAVSAYADFDYLRFSSPDGDTKTRAQHCCSKDPLQLSECS